MEIMRIRLPNTDTPDDKKRTPESAIEAHLEIESFREMSNNQANILRPGVGLSYEDEARIRDEALDELSRMNSLSERYKFLVDSEYTPYLGSVNLSSVHYPAPDLEYEEQRETYRDLCRQVEPDKIFTREHALSDITYAAPDVFVSKEDKPMAIIERSRRLMSKQYEGFEVKIRKRMSVLALDLSKIDSYSRSNLETVAQGIETVFDKTGIGSLIERVGFAQVREYFAELDRQTYAEVTGKDMEKLFDNARKKDFGHAVVVSNLLYAYIESSS